MLTKIDQRNKPPWKWRITYDDNESEGIDELDYGNWIQSTVYLISSNKFFIWNKYQSIFLQDKNWIKHFFTYYIDLLKFLPIFPSREYKFSTILFKIKWPTIIFLVCVLTCRWLLDVHFYLLHVFCGFVKIYKMIL